MKNSKESKYVSRAGEKLEFAIKEFNLEIKDKIIADFGSSTGGFVDCLLQNEAKKVYSIDTAKNMLNEKIRNNPKVEVIIGNAMHINLKEKVDLITIDVAWTKQELIIPNGLKNLKLNGLIVSLIKPQYEAEKYWLTKGIVEEKFLNKTIEKVKEKLSKLNIEIIKIIKSPLKGAKGKNTEFLMLIKKL